MSGHAGDAGVFVRSMATRGQLGGLARATRAAAGVLASAGFGRVIIETVGVGQAEVDVARAADLTVVVVAPGAGDDVQALKAGVMEIGDVFVVNKADRDGADRAAAALTGALDLAASPGDPPPVVLQTIATTGQGVAELIEEVERRLVTPSTSRPRIAEPVATSAAVLDHVGVAVPDAQALAELLQHLFGLATGPAEQLGLHRLRFVDTGPATLELVEATSADAPIATFLASRGGRAGLHHVCLRVPDIEAALARLEALGVRLIDETPRPGAHGSRIAFLHPDSTAGILVEIKQ
jgi:LAO/AO transport system kinase